MININSGTFDQLKTRVGIGDTYAKRIVEGRPYQRTDELVTKNVIPQMTYDKIKDQIITRSKEGNRQKKQDAANLTVARARSPQRIARRRICRTDLGYPS